MAGRLRSQSSATSAPAFRVSRISRSRSSANDPPGARPTRSMLDVPTDDRRTLLHDIHPTTVQAVPGIVDELRAQGYTLVTVPELLGERVQPGAECSTGDAGSVRP